MDLGVLQLRDRRTFPALVPPSSQISAMVGFGYESELHFTPGGSKPVHVPAIPPPSNKVKSTAAQPAPASASIDLLGLGEPVQRVYSDS